MAAAEELSRRGVSACFYVPTGVIGLTQQGEVDSFFGRRQAEGVMTWDDLEHLVSLGHVVGSHGVHHRPLADAASQTDAEAEVKLSVQTLRERLGTCEHFAWPFGGLRHAPTSEVVRWCSEVGVVAASGVRGRNTDRTFNQTGYLLRDAVDLRWIGTDFRVFSAHRYLAEQR
ncbi:polysaccharide deacetylase family protein [Microlunatus sp. Gsoil 973]|uniref:polysaccharide deacetylase family protein n=1 Tax=Microlunatus sp. Gsoil 973 TaxID=2672569 RepID=UPI00351B45A7